MKKSQNSLRQVIEETIGRRLLENYCKEHGTAEVKMFPPIPESKFMDKLQKGVASDGTNAQMKEHQEAYAAEVKLYRRLQEITGNCVVFHQLEYTHEQYPAFLPGHQCKKNKCKKGQDDHYCHKD